MKKLILYLVVALSFISCKEKLPVVDDLSKQHYSLVDQSGQKKVFPDLAKGKISVVSYIFTNCPDICPLTTNNMRLIQERLKKEKVDNVKFVSISFDPEHDKPQVLTKFAGIRHLDLSNWTFLTGNKSTTDSIIARVGVMAVVSDSATFSDGRKIYFYVHTDRIQLIDTEGKIRKNYKGSKIDIDEIVRDIKLLYD